MLLDQFEAGDLSGWWRLNLAMMLKPTRTLIDELESDLTALPGWQQADASTRAAFGPGRCRPSTGRWISCRPWSGCSRALARTPSAGSSRSPATRSGPTPKATDWLSGPGKGLRMAGASRGSSAERESLASQAVDALQMAEVEAKSGAKPKKKTDRGELKPTTNGERLIERIEDEPDFSVFSSLILPALPSGSKPLASTPSWPPAVHHGLPRRRDRMPRRQTDEDLARLRSATPPRPSRSRQSAPDPSTEVALERRQFPKLSCFQN